MGWGIFLEGAALPHLPRWGVCVGGGEGAAQGQLPGRTVLDKGLHFPPRPFLLGTAAPRASGAPAQEGRRGRRGVWETSLG